ncbi:MAG: hypothetical protein A3C06_03565 [Candidatus Taylorbacteria bacterium RIFCSPHIGHO2_02_FULL_46_13]|uniref:Uncharacterized protein n=1 Tax=Candidatus Taylorbacteria bacterium RIFCSPHIGHO2_02_FULL_46_13 TaxID=1802312 RepID=A0A1G2MQN2_9BACT|nr:MAG: hypothetical protein A3C06_03565 [Candidatus Taylorbacteria bacterium RIFCSPHIGHO2_02_FULL_46_13]
MDWKELRLLLARPTGFLQTRIQLKKDVSDILSEVLGVSFPEESITIKNGVAFLACHPVLRSEVLIKKPRIFELLKGRGISDRVSDIR